MKQSLSQSAAMPIQAKESGPTYSSNSQTSQTTTVCAMFASSSFISSSSSKWEKPHKIWHDGNDNDEHQTMNMLFLVCRFELIINVPLKRKTLKWVKQCKRSKRVAVEHLIVTTPTPKMNRHTYTHTHTDNSNNNNHDNKKKVRCASTAHLVGSSIIYRCVCVCVRFYV